MLVILMFSVCTIQTAVATPFEIDLKDLKKPSIPESKPSKTTANKPKEVKQKLKHLPKAVPQIKAVKPQNQKTTVSPPRQIARPKPATTKIPEQKPSERKEMETAPAPPDSSEFTTPWIAQSPIPGRFFPDSAEIAEMLEICPVPSEPPKQAQSSPVLTTPPSGPRPEAPVRKADTSEVLPPENKKTVSERPITIAADSICKMGCRLLERIGEIHLPGDMWEHLARFPQAIVGVSYEGVSALLTCGLPRAEEYTARRLLEMKGIRLISLSNDDGVQDAFVTIAEVLGIPYRVVSESEGVFSLKTAGGVELSVKPEKTVPERLNKKP